MIAQIQVHRIPPLDSRSRSYPRPPARRRACMGASAVRLTPDFAMHAVPRKGSDVGASGSAEDEGRRLGAVLVPATVRAFWAQLLDVDAASMANVLRKLDEQRLEIIAHANTFCTSMYLPLPLPPPPPPTHTHTPALPAPPGFHSAVRGCEPYEADPRRCVVQVCTRRWSGGHGHARAPDGRRRLAC